MRGSHDKAKKYALKLLSYRGRSEKELEDRLRRKGISKTVAHSTINYLRGIGLVDDISLAETLKREALHTKLLSQIGAKNYLISKGISKEIVESLFRSDENEDIENARRLVDKKIKILQHYSSETVRRRLSDHLLRRGYSYDTISKVLKNETFKKEDEK